MSERLDRMEKILEELLKADRDRKEEMKKEVIDRKKEMENERKIRKEEREQRKEEMKKEDEKKKLERKEEEKQRKEETKEMRRELWWIWRSQEEVGVDLFKRNMKSMLAKRNINIDFVRTRFKNSIKINNHETLDWEYDLMWINGKDIVVVEVKNKLRDKDLKRFLNVQLPKFKILFPQYKHFNLYWWVWSLVVSDNQEHQAEKQWLFVFTQWKDWQASIMNKKDFKAKVF